MMNTEAIGFIINDAAASHFYGSLACVVLLLFLTACVSPDHTPVIIDVDSTQIHQEILGFGGSLTESSAWLLHDVLTPEQRKQALMDLFHPQKGIRLGVLRQPMGACDFSLDNYTYAPEPEDRELRFFTVARDEQRIIPLLREASALNPDLKLMATPWSAPPWMKDSGEYHSGSLKPELYPVYADYFVHFIRAYKDRGLTIRAVTLQNEPGHEPCGYPCMRMDPRQQADFAAILGERFEQNAIGTKILIWDHNWEHAEDILSILEDPGARRHIAGVAFHCYSGDVSIQARIAAARPGVEIHLTECSGGQWSPHFADNLVWDVRQLIIGVIRYGGQSVLKWNLATDENYGPQNGGCSDCRGILTIHRATGRVSKNEEYYALGHASKFLLPGARRISSGDENRDVSNAAFINPNGALVVIAVNAAPAPRHYLIRWRGLRHAGVLPPQSVITLTWSQTDFLPQNDRRPQLHAWLTTGDQSRLLARLPNQRFNLEETD